MTTDFRAPEAFRVNVFRPLAGLGQNGRFLCPLPTGGIANVIALHGDGEASVSVTRTDGGELTAHDARFIKQLFWRNGAAVNWRTQPIDCGKTTVAGFFMMSRQAPISSGNPFKAL